MPSEGQRIRVLIVSDNAGMRDGIRALIDSELDMVVAGEANDCEEAMQKFKALLPDIIIGHIDNPVIWATRANLRTLSQFPQARVIVISSLEGDKWIQQAYRFGVRAILYQDMLRSELPSAIRSVNAEQRYVPKAIAMRLGNSLSK